MTKLVRQDNLYRVLRDHAKTVVVNARHDPRYSMSPVATGGTGTPAEQTQVITSGSFVAVATHHASAVTHGAPVMLITTVRVTAISGGNAVFSFSVDGTPITIGSDGVFCCMNTGSATFWTIIDVVPGNHTFRVIAKTAGSVTVFGGDRERIAMMEIH